MASVQMAFAIMPALVYLFAGLRLAAARGDPLGTLVRSRRCRPAVSSHPVAAQRGDRHPGVAALFQRIFEYLDLPSTSRGAGATTIPREVRGEVRFEDVSFRLRRGRARTHRRRRRSTSPPARRLASWGRRARARRRSATSSPACTRPVRRVTIDGVDVRDLSFASWRHGRLVSQETYLFHATIRRD
jgi:ATP-binding cassette subfamily B protein